MSTGSGSLSKLKEKSGREAIPGVESLAASPFVELVGGGAYLPLVAWLLVPPLHRSDKEQGGSGLKKQSDNANWIDLRIEFAHQDRYFRC